MKKFVSVLLVFAMLAILLAGCGSTPEAGSDRLSIVTTIFPEFDWVMNLLGDKADSAEVTMLLDTGVDLHSYQPTADDIIRISNCDIFIYVGGESDEWAEDALKETVNKDMIVVNLLGALGESAKEEELIEGMEGDAEEANELEYDEHVWLSLKNAALFVGEIRDALVSADADNADTYKANADSYIEKLSALDREYQTAVDAAAVKTLLFCDRFPFRYLVDDYGLSYYAAFSGCSAESEASFETVAFLADKLDSLGLSAVLTLEGSDNKIAQTVIASSESKASKILTVDSMQAVTAKDAADGASYLAIMENNLQVFKEALK